MKKTHITKFVITSVLLLQLTTNPSLASSASVTKDLGGGFNVTIAAVGSTTLVSGGGTPSSPLRAYNGQNVVNVSATAAGGSPLTGCSEIGTSALTLVFSSGTCDIQIPLNATLPYNVKLDHSGGNVFLYVQRSSTPASQVANNAPEPTPAKYSGPEFSSLSLKPVMHGSSTTLAGKRLSQVSSIEIGGKAATFTSISDTELSLTPAADLAPGTYDLVIHSSAGKLTHINAVRVQPALRPFSITTRSEGRISEIQYYEHSLIAAMQQPELTKARCIVNGANLALAKAQAERLCALVAAANPNIETTVIEPRSTVKNNTVFARVTYGWN